MPNHLQHETSPYLLQHKDNPVDWYPWGEEAFRRAKEEDKPVFLSIGYSTCHWCHVMAHESFEDEEIAQLLNRHFISIKVDKEERPDIDSIYMSVCQAFTGSGGWPTSIFMTAQQKPFFAGTYFPKHNRGRMPGLAELLAAIHHMWIADRPALLSQAEEIVSHLSRTTPTTSAPAPGGDPVGTAVDYFKSIYDPVNGGFGSAPKFPSPHNLLLLLTCYERRGDKDCLDMAEHTLVQMYRGGLFDHIGYGFCRYSTDEQFLAPHFEKMLYDNALLILACCKTYSVTKKQLYLSIAEKTAAYILREMTSPEGGFYSAQDADSDGEEGKYYLFTPDELTKLLGQEQGTAFCRRFDITSAGNFEGKSIPNLLGSETEDDSFDSCLENLRQYRRGRCELHLDDKILTAWNGLMIAAMCRLYQASGKVIYLNAATRADGFLRKNLREGDTLFVSFRAGKRGVRGFLDDYAACLFAQLALYSATLQEEYLQRAKGLCRYVREEFWDREKGGFYLYGQGSEALILRPKETYDGAIPSGNSLMAWNLVRLSQLCPEEIYTQQAEEQLAFLTAAGGQYPAGHTMFLLALLDHNDPPPKITVVLGENKDGGELPVMLPAEAAVTVLGEPTAEYPRKDGQTTFYLCRSHTCLPPQTDPGKLLDEI